MTEGAREQGRGAVWTNPRTASWLAWSMCALALGLQALNLVFMTLNLSHPDAHIAGSWSIKFLNTLLTIGFSTVGAVIVSRAFFNPIGWLLCVIGFLWAVDLLPGQYAVYALLAAPGSLPAAEAAAWLYTWLWAPPLILMLFLFLLFPDGRLPGSRWRWFAWFSALFISMGAIIGAFSPGPIGIGLGPIRNPLGVEALPKNILELGQPLYWTLLLVAVASLFVRLRRAGEVERQQIKWFAYAAVLLFSSVILADSVAAVMGARWLEWVGFLLMSASSLGIPISIGIAITRYRLYDIDLLINRTLVYAALTATLVLIYLGGVVVLQRALAFLTGEGSQLAVVASTLAIAALFNPLRRRVQAFVDRRFYRRKYDARRTLEEFSAKLRDETDLEALGGELVGVVRETVQPAHVSLWLRAPERRSRETVE